MKKKQHYLKLKLAIVYLFFSLSLMAQENGFLLKGEIRDKKSKELLGYATIQILELNRWIISGIDGVFILKNIPKGNYTIEAHCLGFKKRKIPITIDKNIFSFTIEMRASSLALDEVTVVAKENTNLSSSSKIENRAIGHVQPTNLSDVMQLVPGQITINPNMSRSNQVTIRDINNPYNPADNDALGTAIIIDGTPLDNDANMQTLNTAGGGTAQSYSTAGQGVDLRQISTNNIESVEVIRGIPSVEYGDLTTGAVLVKTKAGKTKFDIKTKADPKIKQIALSKGFLVSRENRGALNIDLDYTHSYDDLRKPSRSYKRITSQIGYSNVLFKNKNPLSINAKLKMYGTFDNEKSDPDQLREDIFKEKEQGVGVKLYGKWSVKKKWIENLSYNLSGRFKKQDYYEYKITANNGAAPVPLAKESGIERGALLPSQYFSELTIDGKPYNFFATIKADSKIDWGKVKNKILYGVDWRTSGNNGKGRIYNPTRPPLGAISTRPRAFNDVPVSNKLAAFIEDKFTIPLGETELITRIGLRYNKLFLKKSINRKGIFSVEPRINAVYNIMKYDNKRAIKNLSFRLGYGKTSKTPTIIQLYPDKSYQDELSFNYYPDLIVVTTKVIKATNNSELKPMENTKLEMGVDFNLKGVKFVITAFKENIRNGFGWRGQYFPMSYKKWTQLEGEGKNPVFKEGNIYYVEQGEVKILDFYNKKDFHHYRYPDNNYSVNKKGIEYVIDFGNIKSIKTNFRIDGAYYHINRITSVKPFFEYTGASYVGKKFPFFSVFQGNKGVVNQRLNSNFKAITHIPYLKMVFTIGTQIIWLNKHVNYWKDTKGSPIAYSLDKNNNKLYGKYQGTDKIYVDPIGYYDMDMKYHEWQSQNSFDAPYAFMVKNLNSNYFTTDSYPVLWQINLKLTKEFGNKAKLSFFANNLFNHKPLQKNKRTGYYIRRNQTAYFGAELKFNM